MEAYAFALASECAATPQYSPSWLVAKSVCDFGIVKQDDAQAYAEHERSVFQALSRPIYPGLDARLAPARHNVPVAD